MTVSKSRQIRRGRVTAKERNHIPPPWPKTGILLNHIEEIPGLSNKWEMTPEQASYKQSKECPEHQPRALGIGAGLVIVFIFTLGTIECVIGHFRITETKDLRKRDVIFAHGFRERWRWINSICGRENTQQRLFRDVRNQEADRLAGTRSQVTAFKGLLSLVTHFHLIYESPLRVPKPPK